MADSFSICCGADGMFGWEKDSGIGSLALAVGGCWRDGGGIGSHTLADPLERERFARKFKEKDTSILHSSNGLVI